MGRFGAKNNFCSLFSSLVIANEFDKLFDDLLPIFFELFMLDSIFEIRKIRINYRKLENN